MLKCCLLEYELNDITDITVCYLQLAKSPSRDALWQTGRSYQTMACKWKKKSKYTVRTFFGSKPFVWNLFVLSEWPKKKVKTRGDDRKACKPGGRKFGMEINFVLFFKYTKATQLNSLRKFLLLQSMKKHFFIKFYYFRFFPFFVPPPPCLFFTDQATRQISTDATSVQSQQQAKPRHSSHNVIAEKFFHLRYLFISSLFTKFSNSPSSSF